MGYMCAKGVFSFWKEHIFNNEKTNPGANQKRIVGEWIRLQNMIPTLKT